MHILAYSVLFFFFKQFPPPFVVVVSFVWCAYENEKLCDRRAHRGKYRIYGKIWQTQWKRCGFCGLFAGGSVGSGGIKGFWLGFGWLEGVSPFIYCAAVLRVIEMRWQLSRVFCGFCTLCWLPFVCMH